MRRSTLYSSVVGAAHLTDLLWYSSRFPMKIRSRHWPKVHVGEDYSMATVGYTEDLQLIHSADRNVLVYQLNFIECPVKLILIVFF